MNADRWRKARALFWVFTTLLFVVVLLFLAGSLTIPGLPPSQIDLSAYRPWIFAGLILLSTKALLEVLRPVFRSALKSHFRYEADIFAHFKLVAYVVWGTALAFVGYILLGAGQQQFSLLSLGVVSAAVIYVMQEPLLAFVGWLVLVTMRIYKLGDRIEVNNTRGYVVGISPINTTIREFGGSLYADIFTGRHVVIPNSQILKGNVFNYTKDTPFVWDQLVVSVTYESDHKLAERLIVEAAHEIVGPMMRENLNTLRSKYEFSDLADYIMEEPRVGWGLNQSSVDLTLMYFCPVFEKATYRTALVKRIIDKVLAEPTVQFAYPHVQFVRPDATQEPGAKDREPPARVPLAR